MFIVVMEVILKAAEECADPVNLIGRYYMLPLKAFMDDTTVISSNEDETCQILELLDGLISWCRVNSKPNKSRSLSVRKDKIDAATTFTGANNQEPVMRPGGRYDSSMKDTRRG